MASLDPARLSYEVAAATSGQSTARGGSSAMASYSEGPDDLAFDLEDEECTMEIKSEPVAKKGLLGLRAVTSEAWDEDFLFQISSSSDLHLPLADETRPRRSKVEPPAATLYSTDTSPRTLRLRSAATPSLDSLASSAWGSDAEGDADDTLTLARHISAARAMPSSHSSKVQGSREASASYSRSTTPSLVSAHDATDATTAEEPLTEPESVTSDDATDVVVDGTNSRFRSGGVKDKAPARRRKITRKRPPEEDSQLSMPSHPPSPPHTMKRGDSKRWNLGGLLSSGGAVPVSRRTRPREIVVMPSTSRSSTSSTRTTPLPSPPSSASSSFVVFGRRARAGFNAENEDPTVTKSAQRGSKASQDSSVSCTSEESEPSSRRRRLSLDFLGFGRRSRSVSSTRGSSSTSVPLREYDDHARPCGLDSTGATDPALDADGDELSGDEDETFSVHSQPRQNSPPPSSILAPYSGARWAGSQVSFADAGSVLASGVDPFGVRLAQRDGQSDRLEDNDMNDDDDGTMRQRLRTHVKRRETTMTRIPVEDTADHTRALSASTSRIESAPTLRTPRQRSVTTGSTPTSALPLADADWISIHRSESTQPQTPDEASLPRSPSSSSLMRSPSRLLRRASARLRRNPTAPSNMPPFEPTETKRPLLSLSNLLSRSASSLPLSPKRAPSSPPPPLSASSASSTLFVDRTLVLGAFNSRHRQTQSASSPSTSAPPHGRASRLPRLVIPSGSADVSSGTPAPPRSPGPAASSARVHRTSLKASRRGQLNEGFRMPISADTTSRPISTASSTSVASTIREPTSAAPFHAKTRHQRGHRPSLSLSSALSSRLPPPFIEPPARTSSAAKSNDVGHDQSRSRPPSIVINDGAGVARRNSLSELRIPARITSAQARIEEDLERVKQFATGVEELKLMRKQYHALVSNLLLPADTSPTRAREPEHARQRQEVRRIEIDFQSWWEQADTLVDLGDGKPRPETKYTPGAVASKRDRCVSLAPPSARRAASEAGTQDDMTDSPALENVDERPCYIRRPSASSIETSHSIQHRQKEMLRDVLLGPHKGSSMPSRGPPSPRPSLSILSDTRGPPRTRSQPAPTTISTVKPDSALGANSRSTSAKSIRRVSRAGVSGIKDFLLRLKFKMTEDAKTRDAKLTPSASASVPDLITVDEAGRRSVSDPTRRSSSVSNGKNENRASIRRSYRTSALPDLVKPSSNGLTDEEDEDWDRELAVAAAEGPTTLTGSVSSTLRRTRTHSSGSRNGLGSNGVAGSLTDRMVLTTEAMPSLLLKVAEVRDRCRECIGRVEVLSRESQVEAVGESGDGRDMVDL